MAQSQVVHKAPVHKAHVAPWKKDEVERLKNMMREHPVIALLGVGGIPSPQMLTMRAMLREHGELKSGKNNLMILAIEQMESERPGIKVLLEHLEGQAAILATDANPYKLYKQLLGTRQMMPAKGGDIAPNDITVEKGETDFKPGPIVGELQKAGIPAAIDKGKVVIKQTKTVVKAGEAISTELAQGLAKLNIFPIEVGLRLEAVFEEGNVFEAKDLNLEEVAFGTELVAAIRAAHNLDLLAPTELIAGAAIGAMHQRALGLGVQLGILNAATTPLIIGRATREALALAKLLKPEALDEEVQAMVEKAASAAAAAPAAPAAGGKQEEKKEEEKEEPGVSEEEAAAGLGALFG